MDGDARENGMSTADPRARVFAAAEPLFERFGFRKTTVEEICEEAGSSKKTFYELFQNKGDLFQQMVAEAVDRMTGEWELAMRNDDDPLRGLVLFLDLYERMAREHPAWRAMFSDFDVAREFGENMDRMRLMAVGGPLHQLLERGLKREVLRFESTQGAILILFSLLDSMYYLIPELTGMPGALEDPLVAEATRSFILRGLGVRTEGDAT